jgi:hypothetical protein
MATREPLQYHAVDQLPEVTRSGGGGGTRSPFLPLIEDAKQNPGQWFQLDCAHARQASNRAQTLRKHDLEAHARNGVVYFRASTDGAAT